MRASIQIVFVDGSSREHLEQRMAELGRRAAAFKPISSLRAISSDGEELVDLVLRDVQLVPEPKIPQAAPRANLLQDGPSRYGPEPASGRSAAEGTSGPPRPRARSSTLRTALATMSPRQESASKFVDRLIYAGNTEPEIEAIAPEAPPEYEPDPQAGEPLALSTHELHQVLPSEVVAELGSDLRAAADELALIPRDVAAACRRDRRLGFPRELAPACGPSSFADPSLVQPGDEPCQTVPRPRRAGHHGTTATLP
jgi:hypothetical protein